VPGTDFQRTISPHGEGTEKESHAALKVLMLNFPLQPDRATQTRKNSSRSPGCRIEHDLVVLTDGLQ